MICDTGFWQDDLNIHLYAQHFPLKHDYNPIHQNNYRLIWIIEGRMQFRHCKQTLGPNNLILFKPNCNAVFRQSGGEQFALMFIDFHPSLYQNAPGDENFLRAFGSNDENECIYNIEKCKNSYFLYFLESLKNCIFNHSGRIHILSRLTALLSELDFIYDQMHPPVESLVNTTNLSVKMMHYIDTHYTGKLSLETVKAKFFVSFTTINILVRKYTGMSFKQYVSFLRLEEAKRLIKATDYSCKRIAELCGFSDYSSFFCAYKKKFGHPPKMDRNQNNKRPNWPLYKDF